MVSDMPSLVLVEPPNMQRSGEWRKQGVYRTPTNLAILAALARQKGYAVKILDFDVDGGTVPSMAARVAAT